MIQQILLIIYRAALFVSDIIQFVGIISYISLKIPVKLPNPKNPNLLNTILGSQIAYPKQWLFIYTLTYFASLPYIINEMKRQFASGNINRWRAWLWILFILTIVPPLFYLSLIDKLKITEYSDINILFAVALSSLLSLMFSFPLTDQKLVKFLNGIVGLSFFSLITHYFISLIILIGIISYFFGLYPTLQRLEPIAAYNFLGLITIFIPFVLINIINGLGGETNE